MTDGASAEDLKADGPSASTHPPKADIYVYDGPHKGHPGTTCPDCATTIVRLAASAGFTAQRIYADQVTRDNLRRARVFVWPGGGDDSDATFREFRRATAKHHDNVAELKNWVQVDGGRYLGVCMGGYLAGRSPEGLAFNLIAGADIPSEAADTDFGVHAVAVAETTYPGSLLDVFYQAGPYFPEAPAQEVLARYQASGHIAALIRSAGAGAVGVLGPHFEATHDWYGECSEVQMAPWRQCSTLPAKEAANHSFFTAFLDRLEGF